MTDTTTTPVAAPEKADGQKVNVEMAVIAYFIFFVPLLTDAKDDPFVKFHLKQAILLVIGAVISSMIAAVIPVIGVLIISPILSIGLLILWIMGLVSAINKEKKELPIIGKYAEQLLKF